MTLIVNPLKVRWLERIFLIFISLVTGMLFFKMSVVFKKDFAEVPSRLKEGTMINVNEEKPGEKMKLLLTKGFYFNDPQDIELISLAFERGRKSEVEAIDNIGELNKSRFNINAEEASLKGGRSYKKRVEISKALLGFSEADSILLTQGNKQLTEVTSVTSIGTGGHNIRGTIKRNDQQPVAGVIVRLQMIVPEDSAYSFELTDENKIDEFKNGVKKVFVVDSANIKQLQTLTAYARTNIKGKYSFTGLPANQAYNLIPLQSGYQFGRSQGISDLRTDVSFNFIQSPHTLKLFSTRDFSTLKKEKAFIVRTPEEAMHWFWIIVAAFFFSFFLLHLLLSLRFPEADQLILPVLMLLTALSFITLLSLQDPLRDRFLAKNTLIYFGAGFTGILILVMFNLRSFTTDSGLYRLWIFKNIRSAANGWPLALAAISLLLLTIVYGTGPEGSGVKVNLSGFQPSEMVKFLVIIFLAGFFAANEKFISEYASWNKRFSFFFFALAAIVTTILLFLILGDLGPAMVCCFTFIILFSFSRGDFIYMAASVILYILSIWLSKSIWTGTAIMVAVLLIYMFFKKKQLSESSIMALVIISGFLLLDKVPYLDKLIAGPVQRLIDRKAIWQDAWNNEVFGGDQVANGIWAMSGGGITGQGAGEGFSKTIPEAHTDMILPAIGEEFGWAGIISIFILFLIYLHRSIIIGRQTGTPFLFYLCSGIGMATFIQFLLIAGGSTGALPLSGVALPFISYGGSSLIFNMLGAGFLLSASHLKGSAAQMKFITRRHDRNLMPALIAAFAGILLLSVNVSRYLFNNKKWVVEPALVADRTGARIFSYNPRINILMNRLQAGNLLDRKGKLLATSQPELINRQKDSLLSLGISKQEVEAFSYKRLDRYYPFGEQMFFWTGDVNTGVFGGGTNGYFAEYAHASELRGFPTPSSKFLVSANRFRQDRFLPYATREMTVSKRDYSALASMLLAGINSKEVEAFKQRNRDVQLTIDAALQTGIQVSLQKDTSVINKRVSVVIMEDNTGDVLASATYPLPPVNDWDVLTLSESDLNKLPGLNVNADPGFTHATQPGSTAKLVTALAAFNKLGDSARTKTILVRSGDLIRLNGPEPDEAGYINIERALVRSNNSFFIRLANEENLQEEMGTLYLQTGMFLHGVGGYFYVNEPGNIAQQNKWRELWRRTEFASVKKYNPDNIRRTRAKGVSGMAWGQGELVATPAAVARLAAGIANKGIMVQNRFVMGVSASLAGIKTGVKITNDSNYAHLLSDFMRKQSANKVNRLGITVAGKTGTPERILKGERINDGWYVFFAPKASGPGHVVVCVRIENTRGSSDAIKLAGKHVIPILLQRGYIKSFEPAVITKNKLSKQAAVNIEISEDMEADTVQ